MIEDFERMHKYYKKADLSYQHWGVDNNRAGVYGLHCGYKLEDARLNHYEEVQELTKQLVAFSSINSRDCVLDAGCGVGAVSFTLKEAHPESRVFGINVLEFQVCKAQFFKEALGYDSVHFSVQDYSQTAFRNDSFDKVLFCESFAHSVDKKRTLSEARRLIRTRGRLVIADAFIAKEPLTLEDRNLLQTIEKGFCLGSYVSVVKLMLLLKELDFNNISVLDISSNVYPSVQLIATHAQDSLRNKSNAGDIITQSRLGCIALPQALEDSVLSYFFIRADV